MHPATFPEYRGTLRAGAAAEKLLALLSISACLLAVACQSPGREATSDGIIQLSLITVPVALDLDGRPGVDGVSVKAFANEVRKPKPVPIRAGTLELLMFDGVFRPGAPNPPVLRTFQFDARELRAFEFRAGIGTGYEFPLLWSTNLPTQRIMSVAGRYTSPNGRVVVSRPSSVTVLGR